MFTKNELSVYEGDKMPAGTYFIGDLGYIISDQDEWMELLETTNYFNEPKVYKHNKIGCLWAAGTAYGDGVYDSNFEEIFTVDSGTIGLINVKYVPKDEREYVQDLAEVRFSSPFKVSVDSLGTFRFGGKRIWTGFDG